MSGRTVPDLIVAGAGMGGLVAAAHARRLGARVVVFERGPRPGGSMLLSSGVIWRHATLEAFRGECPGGTAELQEAVFRHLDRDLLWLETLGARVVARTTGNPRTIGVQFDPRSLTSALTAAAGIIRLGEPLIELPDRVPVVLATGGFHASHSLVRQHITPEAGHLFLRATSWSRGDGLRLALHAGATPTRGLNEFYGRNMPAVSARIHPRDFVRLAQLYACHASVRNAHGECFETRTWSEIDVVQWTAQQPRARAWFEVPRKRLSERVRDRSVGELVEAAAVAGAPVNRRRDSVVVETVAGITTTLGGINVDVNGQAAPGLFACGVDVGGIATGGYASGLATALVLGRIAAESALGVERQ